MILRLQQMLTFSRIVAIVIAAFAFLFCVECGRRGFMPLDQSIVIDAGYRIYRGQIPYKDFVAPYGPIVFTLQAIAFACGGVSYMSCVVMAALGNAVATLFAYSILRRLCGRSILWPAAGSVITAVWFFPPFGTFYPEQTSFLFGLIALVCAVPRQLDTATIGNMNASKLSAPHGRDFVAGAASGFFVGIAFLCKQNCGAFLIPLVLIILLVSRTDRWLKAPLLALIYAFGFAVVAISFAIWLSTYADLGLFNRYFFTIPSEIGATRLFTPMSLSSIFLGRSSLNILRMPFTFLQCGVLAAVVQLSIWALNWTNISERRYGIASILYIGIYFYHNCIWATMNNSPVLGCPYLGIALSILCFLITILLNRLSFNIDTTQQLRLLSRATVTLLLFAGYACIFCTLFGIGTWVSLSRFARDASTNSIFSTHCDVPMLKGLKWGDPTEIKGHNVQFEDVQNVYNFLQKRQGSFFVLGDFTIFYSMLGKAPPQPIIWFHNGLTYPSKYDQKLDRWIVDDLIRNDVQSIVFEEVRYLGSGAELLSDFPLLGDFFAERFELSETFGIFQIYIKKASPHP